MTLPAVKAALHCDRVRMRELVQRPDAAGLHMTPMNLDGWPALLEWRDGKVAATRICGTRYANTANVPRPAPPLCDAKLTVYINRAGAQLQPDEKKRPEQAKDELRSLYHPAPRPAARRR